MDEELKPHHYWREDRITGRLVVITPDEYEQWGKDNQPSEAYRPAFTRAQLPSQGGEAVAWHTEDHLTDKSATTYDREVAERWRAKGWPVTTLYTHPADQVAEPGAELVELLREARELIEHGDFREGHCMCGSAVESHGFGDGHSPVDAGVYYAGQVMERIDTKLASLEVKP